MSGRGRGKRSGTGLGPGRPPKFPNLNSNQSQPGEEPSFSYSPSESSSSTSLPPNYAPRPVNATGGLVDILNQLDIVKRNDMIVLVGQYRTRSLGLTDFMNRARDLLGDRLYSQLARDMNNSARAAAASSTIQPQPPQVYIPHPQQQQQSQVRPPIPQPIIQSMPQIYNPATASSINPSIQHIPGSIVVPSIPNLQSVEVDVSKMDTSSLQDVIQYSGVDLKAEAEMMLYRDHDVMSSTSSNIHNMNSSTSLIDHRLNFDYFFNPFKFRAIVQHALQRHYFSTSPADRSNGAKLLVVSEEAVHLLGVAIQKRLISVIRRLSEISRHRVDYGRGRFKIKIENDPKKQLWLQEKLFIEGVGEERRKLKESAAAVSPSATASSTGPVSEMVGTAHAQHYHSGINQTILNPPKLNTLTSAGKNVSASAPGDDSVKTKMANVTAMAALGFRQKSWMSSATLSGNPNAGSTQTTSSNHPSIKSSQDDADPSNSPASQGTDFDSHQQHPLAEFYSLPSSTPLTDAELRSQYANRTISTVDLITCMETDPHLKRSRLLSILYEALPRENKENSPKNNGGSSE